MIDELDKKILELLQENAKLSAREIARKLKDQEKGKSVSFSTVSRRIRAMEDNGIILGYTTMLDPSAFGFNYPICFFLETDPKIDVEIVADHLKKIDELIYIHQVAGDFQIAAMARCKSAEDAAELSKVISRIEGIQKLVSHSVLCTFKEGIKVNLKE